MKRKAVLGLIISGACLYLALRGVDWRAVLLALKGAHYLYIVPNAALVLFGLWLRAVRWRYMTDSIKTGIPLHSLFASTMIGFMVNNILPLRLGEIARPFSLSRKEQISRSAAFATIVLERVFDAFSLFLVSGLMVAFAPFLINDNVALSRAVYALLGVHIGVLAFLVLLKVKTRIAMTVVEKLTGILPDRFQRRILEVIEKFVTGLGVFHDWRGLTKILIWSLLIWMVVGFSNYFIFLAFDLSVPWFAPYVLLVVVSLGVMLPSSPGYVGPFQFFTIQALRLFGIPASVGLSFSLVLHIGNYVPITLLGLYYLRREHFTLRQIEEEVA
jgi:uncharacterized protein (TIRG00374 family)